MVDADVRIILIKRYICSTGNVRTGRSGCMSFFLPKSGFGWVGYNNSSIEVLKPGGLRK